MVASTPPTMKRQENTATPIAKNQSSAVRAHTRPVVSIIASSVLA